MLKKVLKAVNDVFNPGPYLGPRVPEVIVLPDADKWKEVAKGAEAREAARIEAIASSEPQKEPPSRGKKAASPLRTVEHYEQQYAAVVQSKRTPKEQLALQQRFASLGTQARRDSYVKHEYDGQGAVVFVAGDNDPSGRVLRAWTAAYRRMYGTDPKVRF